MPGEPFGHTSVYRNDVDINVAVILSAECDEFSIRRKDRIRFRALGRCQSPDSSSIYISDPEFSCINKSNMSLTEGRLTQESGIVDIDPSHQGSRNGNCQHQQEQSEIKTFFH